LQQRIGRASDNVSSDVNHSPAAAPSRVPELFEGLAGLDPVPFGQHADGLFDPDPRDQRML